MSYVKEDYLLGSKKIIIGDNLHDLVLENLGKIYIRYGNSYKEFNSIISNIGKSTSSNDIIILDDGVDPTVEYRNGALVYDAKAGILYLSHNGKLLLLVEHINENSSKYVRKTGDVMTGQLVIDTKGAPLKVNSTELNKNLNANLLEGHTAEEFAVKKNNEKISGNWTFVGENTFEAENTFKDQTNFEGTAVFNRSDNAAAIRVGTGAIITDGSMGSSSFASGMTGYGWRLDAETNTLEIDNLIVRGVLNVFELVVNKISATNGSLWITDSFKIEKVHRLEYLNANDTINFSKLNVNTYYIPYILGANNSNSKNIEIVTLDGSKHPLADRSTKDPYETLPTFYKFNYLFQIIDLQRFLSKFKGVGITLWEKYVNGTDSSDWGWYVDSKGFMRVCNYDGELTDEDDIKAAQDAELGNYVKVVPNTVITDTYTIDIISNTGNDSLATESDFNLLYYSKGVGELVASDMADLDVLKELAEDEIIQFTYLYQKNPKTARDMGDDFSNVSVTPQDPYFTEQYYTIVDGSALTLNSEGEYYFKNPSENICHINLYYKYFGSKVNNPMNLTKSNLYILESKNDEYPVFKPGDILRCQRFTGNSVTQYNGVVLGLVGSYGFIIQLQNKNILNTVTNYHYNDDGNLEEYSSSEQVLTGTDVTSDATLYSRSEIVEKALIESSASESGDPNEVVNSSTGKEIIDEKTVGTPQKDDALVRIGSIYIGDRRNSMYLTSSEANSPYQDILVNINRPDYSVIYFTPKYRTFEALFNFEGTTRRGTFYLQNDTFKHIIIIGKAYYNDVAFEDIADEEAVAEITSYEDWEENYKAIYDKFINYTVPYTIPKKQGASGDEDYSGVTKPINAWLTYQHNDTSPMYYDKLGNRVKISRTFDNNGTPLTVSFYTSPEETKVLKSFKSESESSLDFKDGDQNKVTISLGKLV